MPSPATLSGRTAAGTPEDLNSPLNYSIKKTLPEQSGGVFFCGAGKNGQKNRPCLCLEQSLFFPKDPVS